MDIPRLAAGGVDLAFRLAESQTISVVLYRRSNVTFDFNANAAESSPSPPTTLKAFEIEHKKPLKGRQTNVKTLLFKTRELGDVRFYEHAVIAGETWLIGEIDSMDTNLSIVEIYREA